MLLTDTTHVLRFLAAKCKLDPEGSTRTVVLYRAYVEWCIGVDERPLPRANVQRTLTELGLVSSGRRTKERNGVVLSPI